MIRSLAMAIETLKWTLFDEFGSCVCLLRHAAVLQGSYVLLASHENVVFSDTTTCNLLASAQRKLNAQAMVFERRYQFSKVKYVFLQGRVSERTQRIFGFIR